MRNLLKMLFVLCWLPLVLPAQDSLSNDEENLELADEEKMKVEVLPDEKPLPPREATKVEMRQVTENQWKRATDGLDFSKDLPRDLQERPQEPTQPQTNSYINWAFWGKLLQILAIAIAVFGLGYAIYRMMQEPSNRQIARDGAVITFDNVEDYLHESDLDRFLREALAAGNFVLAVRLYYLQILKSLSEKQSIAWSREKTNRDYLREMRTHRLFTEFREATQTYERVWYGNINLDENEFARIETPLKNLKNQLTADGGR